MASKNPNYGDSTAIMRLPTEIHHEILSFLDIIDQVSAGMTCRFWQNILAEPSFRNIRYSTAEFSQTSRFHVHELMTKDFEVSGTILAKGGAEDANVQINKISCVIYDSSPPTFLNITDCDFLDEPMVKLRENLSVNDTFKVTFVAERYGAKVYYTFKEDDLIRTTVRELLRAITHQQCNIELEFGYDLDERMAQFLATRLDLDDNKGLLTGVSFVLRLCSRRRRPLDDLGFEILSLSIRWS
ncbi:hypothetical protein AA313_de0204142 [Arthrobotrys entomopaga]|nr:hypothetical protein AA313_de0204142 [Arthrobotrys entomopaga]